MRLHFKPMPGLTIVTVICLAILISLGTWQYQRLQWKTGLLAEIEEAATADPFTSLQQVQEALDAGEPVDFRRFEATFNFDYRDRPHVFYVFSAENRDVSWRAFSAFQNQGVKVFTNIGFISDAQRKEMETTNGGLAIGVETLAAGYVRLARAQTRGAAKSSPDENRWFGFNPLPKTHDWADMVGIDADMRFYIDRVIEATDASKLPIKRPDIRNNHLDYMLTWYSFAIILLIIYFILHYRAGRLGYKNS